MPGGRPRSLHTCPYCGALPSHQRPERAQAVPSGPEPAPAALEAPTRFLVGTYTLPDGRVRALYMYDSSSARAAAAALARDPTLLATIIVDAYEDA